MRHWATPLAPPPRQQAKVDAHAAKGARAFGFSEEALAKFSGGKPVADDAADAPASVDFELWDENQPEWEFFHACGSQWQYRLEPFGLGMVSRRSGLNYLACESVARAKGLKWRKVFADLQAMEFEVLTVDREAAEAADNK